MKPVESVFVPNEQKGENAADQAEGQAADYDGRRGQE